MQRNNYTPVEAKPSATVVMLQDGDGAPELLMVKRRAGDVFGETYAFPGGVIDANEASSHDQTDGRTAAEADTLLGVSDGLSYYSAAIRELFEETGVLLVLESNDTSKLQKLQEYRAQIDRGLLPWASFLQQHRLKMACESLHYFAHWETPLDQPKRWSTRFFLAKMPQDQDATHDSNELTDICWMSAKEILAAAGNGAMKLPFPTMRNLKNLSRFTTVSEMLDWADALAGQHIERTRPVKITDNGNAKWVIRGDPGYRDDGHP